MSDTELVVVQPFGDHAIGDVLSPDAAAPATCVVARPKADSHPAPGEPDEHSEPQ